MQASAQTYVFTRTGSAPLFKRSRLAAAIGITAMMLVAGMSGSAFAAKGGTPGKPVDAGGGGAPDLGDLIVLYRDNYGLPIPTDSVQVADPETGELVDAGLCQQPLAAPGERFEIDGEECTPDPETNSCIIPVDPLSCAVVPAYAEYTQEVDFGRTSVIRAPDAVLEQSLGEVITKVATAQCTTLDPAGRLVNTSEINGETLSATIDSPLENLAIYWQLMLKGYLGTESNQLILPPVDSPLITAARGLGAAIDKTGKVTVDQVVYTNQILGLLDVPTYLDKECVTVREEVQGNMEEVQKCVLDYSDYDYERAVNFSTSIESLPAPAYIPANDPKYGWFEYLGVVDPNASPVLFKIVQGPILDNVFETDPDLTANNVAGFTQAADDAREVIEFTHDRPLPLDYETPVRLCGDPNVNTKYDLSISSVSGLQVPTQIVDGSEGREFTVTVANAGPATVSGEITVTAEAANGGEIAGSPWTITFTDLAAGQSYSKTTFFSINLGERTTIDWTAEAAAVPGCENCEVNPDDNIAYATSTVKVTGSGGGGQGGPAAPATPSASSNGKSGK
jgi:hypothetical protein